MATPLTRMVACLRGCGARGVFAGNAELLELIMVPVTAMVWVRKYHRMTASDRSANRVEQGGMLWVDMQVSR